MTQTTAQPEQPSTTAPLAPAPLAPVPPRSTARLARGFPRALLAAIAALALSLLLLALGYLSVLRYSMLYGAGDQLLGLSQTAQATLEQAGEIVATTPRVTRVTDDAIAPALRDAGKALAFGRQVGDAWPTFLERASQTQSSIEQLVRYQRDWSTAGEDLTGAQRDLARMHLGNIAQQVRWMAANAAGDVREGLAAMMLGVMGVVLAGTMAMIAGGAVALLAFRTARTLALVPDAAPAPNGASEALAAGPTALFAPASSTAATDRARTLHEGVRAFAALAAGLGHDAGNTAMVLDSAAGGDTSASGTTPSPTLRAAINQHADFARGLLELGQGADAAHALHLSPSGGPPIDLAQWLARAGPIAARALPREIPLRTGPLEPNLGVSASSAQLSRLLLTLVTALRAAGDDAALAQQSITLLGTAASTLKLELRLSLTSAAQSGTQTATVEIAPAQLAPAQLAPAQFAPAQFASAQLAPAQVHQSQSSAALGLLDAKFDVWLEAARVSLAPTLTAVRANLQVPGPADLWLVRLALPCQRLQAPPQVEAAAPPARELSQPLLPPLPPMVPLPPLPRFTDSGVPVRGSLEGLTALIISDQSLAAGIIAGWLSSAGAQSSVVATGPDALRWISTESVANLLVLSEIELPGLDGVSLLRKVARLAPHARLIALSAGPDVILPPDLLRLGVLLLPRPLTRAGLVQTALNSL